MRKEIIVFGSLNLDFVVVTPERPGVGRTVLGTEFRTYPGGKGANQAVAAARSGGRVAMAGRVGDDVFSGFLKKSLAEAGVDLELVKETPGTTTGSAFITVDKSGDNSIVVVPGANFLCSREDVDAIVPYMKEARILMLQLEIPLDTVVYAARIGKSMGLTVMLDPAPPCSLPGELVRSCDIITPNEHEASFLTGREVTDIRSARLAASDLLAMGARCAIVKIGKDGVLVARDNQFHYIPGHKVDVVDTTAAGDTFSGAMATGICQGMTIPEAARFANAAAAISVTRKGAQTSMPTRDEIERFLGDMG